MAIFSNSLNAVCNCLQASLEVGSKENYLAKKMAYYSLIYHTYTYFNQCDCMIIFEVCGTEYYLALHALQGRVTQSLRQVCVKNSNIYLPALCVVPIDFFMSCYPSAFLQPFLLLFCKSQLIMSLHFCNTVSLRTECELLVLVHKAH